MKNKDILIYGKEMALRLIKGTDIEKYYKNGFKSIDKEVQLYTEIRHIPTEESITLYVNKIIEDELRYDFLIRHKNLVWIWI